MLDEKRSGRVSDAESWARRGSELRAFGRLEEALSSYDYALSMKQKMQIFGLIVRTYCVK